MNKYTYAQLSVMIHKTLTVSEEAYNTFAPLKTKITKVILRLARKREKGTLLDYVRSLWPDPELAAKIEKVLEKRAQVRPRVAER